MILSPRERQMLQLTASGLSREKIALIMGVGIETIAEFRKRSKYKLHARNITHAVALAMRRGEVK